MSSITAIDFFMLGKKLDREIIIKKRYKVLQSLGENHSRISFRVLDNTTHQDAVLTVLKNQSIRKEFREKTLKLQEIHHPNIVNIVDMGVHNNRVFFVTEYHDYTTIRDRVNADIVIPRHAVQVILYLLDAVEYLYNNLQKKLSHTDIRTHAKKLNIPPQIIQIVEKATAGNSKDRYKNATEFRQELSNFLQKISGEKDRGK